MSIVGVREIYRGWMSLLMVRIRHRDGGEAERHVMLNGRAVCVLPYDPVRKVALVVSMPRAPVVYLGEPDMLEAVAGALDGEDPADCARREAFEEAGVELGALEHLGMIWSMPSNSTERIDYYLASYGLQNRTSRGGGLDEEQEHISVHELALVDLWKMVTAREVRDGKLLTLLLALHLRRPELFE